MSLHKGMKPSDVAPAFESKCYLLLKHRFDGVGVGYGRIKDWNPKEVKLLDMQRGGVFGAENFMNDVGLQRHGFSGIADFEGLRFEHIWQVTIKEILRCKEAGLVSVMQKDIGIKAVRIFYNFY